MKQATEPLFYNQIWLTTKEAAHYCGKSEAGFRAFAHRNHIQRYKLGSSPRYRREDLDALFKRESLSKGETL